MTTSITWAKTVSWTAGKILVVLAVASVIGGLSVGPALGEDNDKRQGQQDRGGHARDQHDDRNRQDNRYRHDYQPIYAPPPVVYVPSPSPGITLFFPWFR